MVSSIDVDGITVSVTEAKDRCNIVVASVSATYSVSSASTWLIDSSVTSSNVTGASVTASVTASTAVSSLA